jgi:hypothetical protein
VVCCVQRDLMRNGDYTIGFQVGQRKRSIEEFIIVVVDVICVYICRRERSSWQGMTKHEEEQSI